MRNDDDEAWVRATVHPVVFEASYSASTMCCAQVQIQVDYAAELDDVGEKREPGVTKQRRDTRLES